MKNHKLFILLKHLSAIERRELEKFLLSPSLNNRKLALQLFQIIKKQKGLTTKENIFPYLFPKQKYKDEKMRLAMSQLVKKIEEFLVYQYQKNQTVENAKILATVYRSKKLEKPFEQTIQNAYQAQDKNALRNAKYFYNRYELALENYNYEASVRTTELNLQEVSDSLDTSFLILKLQQACLSLSHQAVFQQDYQMGLLSLILPYIERNNLTKIPAVGIYYYCYLALNKQEAHQNFRKFKHLLFEYRLQFPPEEWNNLFLLGTNICIKIINSGDHSYLKEILELYKQGLITEALLENGVLSRFVYQNIVTSGMRTDDLKWTRQFLYDYKEKVEKEYRESAFRFNLARLAYHEKNYAEAMDLLRDTDQKDLLINLYSKNLLLKIYYELEEFKLLESFLDAFQIYLRRKKVTQSFKENYSNIIYFTQKLMKVNPFNVEAKKQLRERITNAPILTEREWLLKQLEEL